MSASGPVTYSPDASIQAALDRIHAFGPYGYKPNLVANAVFCAGEWAARMGSAAQADTFCVRPVYGVCAVVLFYQGIRHRRWWLLATLGYGSLLECVGNAMRVYGHFEPTNVDAYIAQQVILVLTPAFFAAAHFTILTKVCYLFNPRYIAPLKPSWLIPFFVLLDVTSLAIQGGGAGKAAVAEIKGGSVSVVNGFGQVVTAGLGVQLAGYLAFNVIFILFVVRASSKQATQPSALWNGRTKLFLVATWTSALLVLGRSIFRTAEMAKGWIGEVATTEWYYLAFDATFVALAVVLLIVVSPTAYLPRAEDHAASKEVLPQTTSDVVMQSHVQLASPNSMRSMASADSEKLNFRI